MWNFNPSQLATWAEARKLAQDIEDYRISSGSVLGGGVAPESKDPETSGIYVPYWEGGPAGFPVIEGPAGSGKFWLHFRFRNGASGINVGLVLDKLARYANNRAYVFGSLGNDLQT